MPKTFQLKILLMALLALCLLGGCGYGPVVLRGPMADANGVNVTLFVNKSYRPGVEGTLARNLVDEFALRTGGRVLPGDQAQLELTGVILSYSSLPISYTSLDTIKEYKSVVSVQATLREKQTQKVLWKGDLSGEQSFPVNTNIALQQNAEEAAVGKACRNLSREIWQKIGERF
jgi:outer membrane lipopolysaccharide assembly protein LptE/RlpB